MKLLWKKEKDLDVMAKHTQEDFCYQSPMFASSAYCNKRTEQKRKKKVRLLLWRFSLGCFHTWWLKTCNWSHAQITHLTTLRCSTSAGSTAAKFSVGCYNRWQRPTQQCVCVCSVLLNEEVVVLLVYRKSFWRVVLLAAMRNNGTVLSSGFSSCAVLSGHQWTGWMMQKEVWTNPAYNGPLTLPGVPLFVCHSFCTTEVLFTCKHCFGHYAVVTLVHHSCFMICFILIWNKITKAIKPKQLKKERKRFFSFLCSKTELCSICHSRPRIMVVSVVTGLDLPSMADGETENYNLTIHSVWSLKASRAAKHFLPSPSFSSLHHLWCVWSSSHLHSDGQGGSWRTKPHTQA